MPDVNYFWDEIEDNVVEEYDENGNTLVEYTTEPSLYGATWVQDRGGQVRHYHYDGQGNTTELTDDNGNVTDVRKYSGFGTITLSTGNTDLTFQWLGNRGYFQSALSNLIAVRNRDYSHLTGRWLSFDPIQFEGD